MENVNRPTISVKEARKLLHPVAAYELTDEEVEILTQDSNIVAKLLFNKFFGSKNVRKC